MVLLVALGSSLRAQPAPAPMPLYEGALASNPPVAMPHLVGLRQSEAEKIVSQLGIPQLQVVTVVDGEPGRVLKQQPESGQATRIAYLYVGVASPRAREQTRLEARQLSQGKKTPNRLPAGAWFALGQVTLGAFAWVAWVRIEEQARCRPLHPALTGRNEG